LWTYTNYLYWWQDTINTNIKHSNVFWFELNFNLSKSILCFTLWCTSSLAKIAKIVKNESSPFKLDFPYRVNCWMFFWKPIRVDVHNNWNLPWMYIAFALDESNRGMQNLAFAQLLSTICLQWLTTKIHQLLQ